MPTGMGVTNPKFAKSVRKPKKIKHCTIPKWEQVKKKFPQRELHKRIGSIQFLIEENQG